MAAEVTFYELPTVEVELPGYLHVGIPGENGATFIPSVDDDGILGWENDKGLENPGSVDLKALLRDTVDQEIPELDATLTVEGAAADAKAVGDAVSDLLSEAAAAVATLQSGISAVEADLDERTGAIAREIEALNAGCVKTVNGIAPDENGNVQVEVPESSGGEMPVFDLTSLGLPAVLLAGGSSVLETDTAEITAALNDGPVAFIVPVNAYGTVLNATLVMNGASADGTYQCISVVNYTGEPGTITVLVDSTQVVVLYSLLRTQVGIPTPTPADNDKILQVVDGVYSLVAVADSAVATYVDDYINSALEGDY